MKKSVHFLRLSICFFLVISIKILFAQTHSSQLIEPRFVIGNTRFNFVGGFIPGWHFGIENCTPEINEDLIKTAKSNGIKVLHLMIPIVEHQIGVFEESEIAKLDQFLFYAEKHGVYVMISFLHAYAIVIQPQYPYHHKKGIEGLIKDSSLKQAFKKRIEFIITRKNSITDKRYFEDPTIMAWIIVDEPISAPWNYPEGPPNVTIQELKDWFEEMAIYIKKLDTNHLVTVFTTAAIDQFGYDWPKAFDTPSLDFIEAEDAEVRILGLLNMDPTEYPLRLLALNKPLVSMLSFSGALDQNIICHDYNWKANTLNQAMNKYFDLGTGGVLLANWGSKLYPLVPSFDECFNYNSSIDTICHAIKEVASRIGSLTWPSPPLQFVKIETTTSANDNINEVPKVFSMSQNYPNPFNPSSIINFEIPKQIKVQLKVCDILGREVATLIDEEKPVGKYEVKFDASKLSNGVYFYTIYAGDFIQTKKLMLIK